MAQYVKNDCEQGFVTDGAEIEYLKLNNMRHTILGCMLGDFDANGKYIVDPEIVKELIAMPKYIVDTVDNIEVCSSLIKLDKQITFFVTYEGEQVSLILAEKVNFQANFKINSGLFSNINEYVLDSFETSGVVDKNVVYSKWNISQFAGEALDVFDMDEETIAKYFGIVNRFKYLMKANQILLQKEAKLEEIESNFAVQMLDLVAKYPELKKVVDAKIKDVVGKKPSVIRLDKPFFAKTVNEIISQTVEENINILPPEQKQEFEVEKRNIVVEHNEKLKQEIEVENLPIVDEKQDVVSSKYVLDTLGVDKKQSLNEVATEFIATQKEVNKQIVQEAVLETVEPKVKEKFEETTGTKSLQHKDELVGKIAEITGQTKQQFSVSTTEETTQEIATTVTDKVKTLKSAQIQSETTKLVTKAVEANQAAAKAKPAGASAGAAKKPAAKKPVAKAKQAADKKAATSSAPAAPVVNNKVEVKKPRQLHDFGDRVFVSKSSSVESAIEQPQAEPIGVKDGVCDFKFDAGLLYDKDNVDINTIEKPEEKAVSKGDIKFDKIKFESPEEIALDNNKLKTQEPTFDVSKINTDKTAINIEYLSGQTQSENKEIKDNIDEKTLWLKL